MALPPIANPRRSSTHQCRILSKIVVSSDIPNILKFGRFYVTHQTKCQQGASFTQREQPTDAQTIEEIHFQCPSTEKSRPTAWDRGCKHSRTCGKQDPVPCPGSHVDVECGPLHSNIFPQKTPHGGKTCPLLDVSGPIFMSCQPVLLPARTFSSSKDVCARFIHLACYSQRIPSG